MADDFASCLTFTLREEGGYVDNPADPGGATNMGITLATYRDWSDDSNLGPAQVQDMTERTARAIYQSLYWIRRARMRCPAVWISASSTWE